MNAIEMTNTTHSLKTSPAYFEQVWRGLKTFEIRFDDRGYQRGDKVVLREWDRTWPCECPRAGRGMHEAGCAKYSGREVTATVGIVLGSMPRMGAADRGFTGLGYVVFSLVNPENWHVAEADPVAETPTSPSPADVARITGARA